MYIRLEVICLLALTKSGFILADPNGNISSDEDNRYLAKNDATEIVDSPQWLRNQNFDNNYGILKASHVVKRAPNGFIGMRGKKDVENAESGNWNIDPLAVQSEQYDDLPEWSRLKKAPNSFYGVRGKKFPLTNGGLLEKFDEDHLREVLFQDFLNRLAARNEADNEVEKRTPTGFTGMRGKRLMLDAMDDGTNYNSEDLIKRTPTNSFMGVRGKKDVSHHQAYKRSPGEDLLQQGKQQHFLDFANKFVAVRGKKSEFKHLDSLMDNNINVQQNDDGMDLGQLYRAAEIRYFVNLLPSFLYSRSVGYKRTPGGFLGMRGKRPEAR